jgi:hypothetical protein
MSHCKAVEPRFPARVMADDGSEAGPKALWCCQGSWVAFERALRAPRVRRLPAEVDALRGVWSVARTANHEGRNTLRSVCSSVPQVGRHRTAGGDKASRPMGGHGRPRVFGRYRGCGQTRRRRRCPTLLYFGGATDSTSLTWQAGDARSVTTRASCGAGIFAPPATSYRPCARSSNATWLSNSHGQWPGEAAPGGQAECGAQARPGLIWKAAACRSVVVSTFELPPANGRVVMTPLPSTLIPGGRRGHGSPQEACERA